MSHNEDQTPEERWDDDSLNELWAEMQETQSTHKSNGVADSGAILEKVGNLTATIEQYTAIAIEKAVNTDKRLDKHSGILRGAEAVDHRLAVVQGLVKASGADLKALASVVTDLAAAVSRLQQASESLQYWLWGVLVLQAAVTLAVLLR